MQLRLQLWEAYCQVRYLCTHLRGNDSADSAVSTDSSMDESSETSSAKDVPAGSLRTALSELKRLIQSVIDGTDSPVSYILWGTCQISHLRSVQVKPLLKMTVLAHCDYHTSLPSSCPWSATNFVEGPFCHILNCSANNGDIMSKLRLVQRALYLPFPQFK